MKEILRNMIQKVQRECNRRENKRRLMSMVAMLCVFSIVSTSVMQSSMIQVAANARTGSNTVQTSSNVRTPSDADDDVFGGTSGGTTDVATPSNTPDVQTPSNATDVATPSDATPSNATYAGILVCGIDDEGHVHEQSCYCEDEEVAEVILMIHALPTADEVDATLLEFEEDEDWEGYESYWVYIGNKGRRAYEAYEVLTEEQKILVFNIDKLMEWSYLWSVAPLIEDISSDAPTAINSASTMAFIDLNLYDYNSNINTNYNSSKNWPGFQWNGGAYDNGSYSRRGIDYIDFGNSMITDRDYAGSGNGKATTAWNIGNNGGNINAIVQYPTGDWANKPVGMSNGTEVLKRTLGDDGYPYVKNAGSMKDYFSNSSFSTKKNTSSIDGLFQINSTTGEYYYNSRWNHAQYGSNKFTLYEDIITPNFITYPFGNFLPLNDITNKNGNNATQVSKIGSGKMGTYVQEVINDLVVGTEDATEQQLIDMLAKYRTNLQNTSTTNGTAWTTWSAKNAIRDYIGHGPTDDTSPITDALLSKMYNIDWDVDTNFFFGMDMKMNFMMPKDGLTGKDNGNNTTGSWTTNSSGDRYLTGKPDGVSDYPMKFYFTGDDDVWVYVDGVLFLDLSGIHRHVGGEIDFEKGEVHYYALAPETGDVSTTAYKTYSFSTLLSNAGKSTNVLNEKGTFKDYSTHEFKFYYMERGSGSSVCRLNFNFPLLRQNSISVEKELADKTSTVGNPDFSFQVLDVDDNGNKTNTLFITAGTTYNIYDADGNETGTGTTDKNGVFKLKAGQRAEFTGIEENAGKYYVRELFTEDTWDQYDEITVSGESTTTSGTVTVGNENFEGADSPIKDMSDGATLFKFINDIDRDKLGSLSIEKSFDALNISDINKEFKMQVKIDNELLAEGQAYSVVTSSGSENKTVGGDGCVVIKHGEKAVISNIIAGRKFTVKELFSAGDESKYTVAYKIGDDTSYASEVSGLIGTNPGVSILVTNHEGDSLEISGTKTIENSNDKKYTFKFELVEVIGKDNLTEKVGGKSTTSEVTDIEDEGNFSFTLEYPVSDYSNGTVYEYYLITEENAGGSVIYDATEYLVEAKVTTSYGIVSVEQTDIWKVNEDKSLSDVSSMGFKNILTGSIVVSKVITGNMADLEKQFDFSISVNDGDYTGYTVTGTNGATVYTEGDYAFALSDGQSVTISNLPLGSKLVVTEVNGDYKATVDVSGTTNHTFVSGETTVTMVDGIAIQYTNTKDIIIDTGISMDSMPYVVMLVLVVAGITFYVIHKRKESDLD